MPLATFGDYQLLHVISTTGTGVSFRARRADKQCVVYVGDPVRTHDRDFRERFEARVEAALGRSALGIAHVTAAGWRGELPWVAMDAEGWTLGEIRRTALATETALEPQLLVDIAISAANALEELHTSPPTSMHGRLTEDQIIVQEDGSVTLVGIGFEATSDVASWPLPQDLHALAAMAPELVGGGPADARVDIYGLCMAIYHSATGTEPYHGEDTQDVSERVLAGHLVDPDAPELPGGMGEVLASGMARSPAERPQTAGELARRLDRVARGLGGAPDPMDWTLLLDELFPDGPDGHRTPPDLIARPSVRRVLQAILSPGALHTSTAPPEPPAPTSEPVRVITTAPVIPRDPTPMPVAPRASERLFRTAALVPPRRADGGPVPTPGTPGSLFRRPIGAIPLGGADSADTTGRTAPPPAVVAAPDTAVRTPPPVVPEQAPSLADPAPALEEPIAPPGPAAPALAEPMDARSGPRSAPAEAPADPSGPRSAPPGGPRLAPPPTSSALSARGAALGLPEPPPRAPSVRAPPDGPPREWTPRDEIDRPAPLPPPVRPITLDDDLVSVVPDPESSASDGGVAKVQARPAEPLATAFVLRDPTPAPAPPITPLPPTMIPGTEPFDAGARPEPASFPSEPPRFQADAVPVAPPVTATPPAPPPVADGPRVPWILLGGLGLVVGVGGGWFLANRPTVTPDLAPKVEEVPVTEPVAPSTPATLTKLDIVPDGEKTVIRGVLQPEGANVSDTVTGGTNGRRARHLIRIPAGTSGIGHKRIAIDSPLATAAVVQRNGDDLTISVDVAPADVATASFTTEPGGFTLVVVPSPPAQNPNP